MTSTQTSTDLANAPRARFTSFEESTQEDWSLIMTQMPTTQSLAATNVIEPTRACSPATTAASR